MILSLYIAMHETSLEFPFHLLVSSFLCMKKENDFSLT